MKIQGGLKKRILLVLVPLIGTFSLALTPTSLKIVGLELSYCEEFLDRFDEAADHNEAIVSSIIDGDILTHSYPAQVPESDRSHPFNWHRFSRQQPSPSVRRKIRITGVRVRQTTARRLKSTPDL